MIFKYRPEIDGLRAIAVCAVIFYHAEFTIFGSQLFKGGFLGVDIFFVISGYLISRIIFTELDQGDFQFSRFYERRVRRILPALFVVLLLSIPAAWLLMLPTELKSFSISLLSILFFVSNHWFWRSTSYMEEPAELVPFLHTWTLSVEEQFYLLYPMLVVAIWHRSRTQIGFILFALAFLSFLLANLSDSSFPDATFYLLPTRGWELLAGCLIARWENDNTNLREHFSSLFLPVTGLFLIIFSLVILDEERSYFVFKTFVTVIGTVLIIAFSKQGTGVTWRLLSCSPLRMTGLISYSLYLWHFPVFAFAKYLLHDLSLVEKLICIALTFLLAVVSYIYIEKPARDKELDLACLLKLLLSALVFFVVFSMFTIFWNGNNALSNTPLLAKTYHEWNISNSYMKAENCFVSGKDKDLSGYDYKSCMATVRGSTNVLLTGDSMPAYYWSSIQKANPDINLLQNTLTACKPLYGTGWPDSACSIRNNSFASFNNTDIDIVILSAFWEISDMQQVEKTVLLLKEQGLEVIIIGPSLRFKRSLPAIIAEHLRNNFGFVERLKIKYEKVSPDILLPNDIGHYMENNVIAIEDKLRQLTQKLDISYFSILDTLCDSDELSNCRIIINDEVLVSFDREHSPKSASEFFFSGFSVKK